MVKAPKKFKYIICRKMIDDSWEFNEFYLNKGIAAKEAIEESAVALFESLGPSDQKKEKKESQNKKAGDDDSLGSCENEDKGREAPCEAPSELALCAILFYDRSEKGTGFLPINIAYRDPYEEKGMLMEGCKSRYTDRFFKKLTDDILSRILAKEARTDVPRASRPNIGYNCISEPSTGPSAPKDKE